ncbi:MAG: ATP-grasp domain-containing protein [Candidatus Pacearchaeota archaeon]
MEKGNIAKVALLHHDMESPELKFKELFEQRGVLIDLVDIRSTSKKELLDYDLIINRVYSSVVSRDSDILKKTLNLLRILEISGKKCINSYRSSRADYSKFELFKELSSKGIPTPKTVFLNSEHRIEKVSKLAEKRLGFPIVVKRDCGGKSYDVDMVKSFDDLVSSLKEKFRVASQEGYNKGFILQEFVSSVREHDCRVGIVGGNFEFSYARSFIPRGSEEKWIASTSGGSVEFEYSPSEAEVNVAMRAASVLDASFSESDIIMTSKGPFVIEVNISPSYFVDSIDDLHRMEIIVNNLINSYISSPSNDKRIISIEAAK